MKDVVQVQTLGPSVTLSPLRFDDTAEQQPSVCPVELSHGHAEQSIGWPAVLTINFPSEFMNGGIGYVQVEGLIQAAHVSLTCRKYCVSSVL